MHVHIWSPSHREMRRPTPIVPEAAPRGGGRGRGYCLHMLALLAHHIARGWQGCEVDSGLDRKHGHVFAGQGGVWWSVIAG